MGRKWTEAQKEHMRKIQRERATRESRSRTRYQPPKPPAINANVVVKIDFEELIRLPKDKARAIMDGVTEVILAGR